MAKMHPRILLFTLSLLLAANKVHCQRSFLAKLQKERKTGSGGGGILAKAEEVHELANKDNDEDIRDAEVEDEDLGLEKCCEIDFEGIEMRLKQKGGKPDKLLLDGSIRGKASSGRMLAIMGPSGAGKTTACLAIAGLVPDSKRISLTGIRYLNGAPLSGDSQLPAAFVKQEDTFFPHMTVRETLAFRVELKLGRKLSAAAREDVVNELMETLSLTKVADTIVGDAKIRGVSGGERKRLSIACEMISSPPVIILDEPTSGLDSYQAQQVVNTLRKLADSGKTVIAVIHQPSQKVFSTFDDLLLISDGRQMYFGEVSKARSYFNNLGYKSESEVGTAEYIIDLVSKSSGNGDASEESKIRIDRIAQEAKRSAEKISFVADAGKNVSKSTAHKMGMHKSHRCIAGIFRQFKLLFQRSFRENFRGKGVILIKAVQQVSTALIYGGIYNLGNNQSSIQDRIGLISLIAIGTTNLAMASTIRSFPKEKNIVTGEVGSKLYNVFPYFISKAIAEIPLVAGLSVLFGSVIYPLVGLQKDRFRNFLGLTSLHSIASQSAGLLIGSISPNSDVSLALFPPIIVLNIIFDGKNIAAENVPRIIRWLPKIGLIRWGYEGMCVNEFTGLKFESSGPFRGPVAKTGEDALARYGLEDASIERAVKAQAAVIGVSWFLSFLGLSATKQKYVVMKPPKKS
mmetsp:Transcript_33730/g.48833  ORF Transcript_33730/g.48833 Transcript_33730/m.48833 type:complete len:685 (-) Transcript_33730:31-2085(-)